MYYNNNNACFINWSCFVVLFSTLTPRTVNWHWHLTESEALSKRFPSNRVGDFQMAFSHRPSLKV